MWKLTGVFVSVLVFVMTLTAIPPAAVSMQNVFPTIVPLPDGFQPEGIAIGRGISFYVGSLENGAIYGGDLRTGEGAVIVPGEIGRVAVGLSIDLTNNSLFVAGGPTGEGSVYDAGNGDTLANYEFTAFESFVNDVVVTRDAAYFTDSFRPFLYRVPFGPHGALPDQNEVTEIELMGDFEFVPGALNANGIDATRDGEWLIIANTELGKLYVVDPQDGYATEIDLGGYTVPSADGILLDGLDLYVVQNFLNQISVVRLEPDFTSGAVVRWITDPNFRVPTTISKFDSDLYLVNARFDVPPAPETEYEVVQVPKR